MAKRICKLIPGETCEYEECTAEATVMACGRDTTFLGSGNKGHPAPGLYCQAHGEMVADEGHPEYTHDCPNCGCLMGVN